MNLFKNIFAISLIGLVLFYALVSFYRYEQNFSSERRNFSSALNDLSRHNSDIKYNILQSSIFAYYNQDDTAHHIELLDEGYLKLKNEQILKDKHYAVVASEIDELGPIINKKVDNIRKYLIINAGIKNSFIFLSREASKSNIYFKSNSSIHAQINSIMTIFSNARRIQDNSYLNINLKGLTSKKEFTKAQKEYIKTFNLHAAYLFHNFNTFTQLIDVILKEDIDDKTDLIDKEFTKISNADMQAVNDFAITLIVSLFILISTIIFLFIKIYNENKLLKGTQQDLDYMLTHDKLTNLGNRYAFEDIVASKSDKFTLLLINIDKFKQINDLYGNSIGNKLLIEVSKFIQLHSLKNAAAKYFRLSGDEFAVLCNNLSLKEAESTAQTLSDLISSHYFIISEIPINFTVSIAINTQYPLLENADMALKYIKGFPEVHYIVFDAKMNLLEKIKKNIEVINLVKEAVAEDRIVPYFQPILNIKSKKIEKYEALVRIINKDGTIIVPCDFIDIIRKTSEYKDITRIMINKVIDIAKDKPYRFSINMSMQDISNDKLMKMLFAQLDLHKSSNYNLDFELLETENLYDINKIAKFITDVKKYGCKILIDDFGTGYSNFSYFSNLDIDSLKIDGSITKEILKDDKKLQILKAINRFAFAIDVETVAEFVENRGIFDKIEEVGIKYAQGYFIGKPSPNLLDDDSFTL